MSKRSSKASEGRGPRGLKGKRGAQGKRGAPGIEPAEIHSLTEEIQQVRDEADVQFKRIAQIQVQLDATLKALKDMGDRAGRQRKVRQ